nr:hypothetical protein [Paracoccus saliphilus]
MIRFSITATALLLPQLAQAHPGHHAEASALHLLTQPDHLATIALITALGVAAWFLLRGRS